MSTEETQDYLRLLGVGGIVATVCALNLVLAREWVKRDLRDRGFQPVLIRWRPFKLWPIWGPAFRVVYKDAAGIIHAARCGVPAWHRPVVWRGDEIVDVQPISGATRR